MKGQATAVTLDTNGRDVIEHGLDTILLELARRYESEPKRPEIKPNAVYRFYVCAVEIEP